MTPKQLLKLIKTLSPASPHTKKLNDALGIVNPNDKSWYKTQKEHWLGWLSEYNGPGAYGRKGHKYDAKYAYNHIMCTPMLFWLCEASGIPKKTLNEAHMHIVKNRTSPASEVKLLRQVIPFEMVELHLLRRLLK